jgi:hypothetical protein
MKGVDPSPVRLAALSAYIGATVNNNRLEKGKKRRKKKPDAAMWSPQTPRYRDWLVQDSRTPDAVALLIMVDIPCHLCPHASRPAYHCSRCCPGCTGKHTPLLIIEPAKSPGCCSTKPTPQDGDGGSRYLVYMGCAPLCLGVHLLMSLWGGTGRLWGSCLTKSQPLPACRQSCLSSLVCLTCVPRPVTQQPG